MKAIIINEEAFEDAFARAEKEFAYEHKFMRGEEKLSDFKKTGRYLLLMRARACLRQLKRDLETS